MSRIKTLGAMAAAAALAVPLAGCADDEPVATPPAATEQPTGQGGADQEDLEGRLGEDVDLTGEVAEVLSGNAFTIGGDQIGENPVLVVGADVPSGLAGGDQVRVSGTVREFQVAGYEEDLDLDLIDDEFEDFDGDPAIQAASVERT